MTQNGSIPGELSSKQTKFVDCLLVGTTLAIAAKTAGISARTAARWKKDPVLIAELKQRRREQFNETLDAFRAGLPTAMAFVLSTIKNTDELSGLRLRASQIWIEHALQVHAIEELAQEIEDLKQRLEEAGDK